MPLIEGCLTDKKWRFKLAIAQNIPNFFKALNYEEHKEFLDKVLVTFFKDHNFAVREQTVKSLIACRNLLTPERYNELVQKFVTQLSGDPNYIYRVSVCAFLKEIDGLDKSQVN